MGSRLLVLFICSAAIAVSESNILKKKFTIDREHLKLDFLKIFGSWTDIFSDAEMDFRYFIAHDQDNNKKLDGLELFTALEHDSKHEEEHGAQPSSSADLEKEVEAILLEHDKDGDGFLDYKEFMGVHKTHPDIRGERKEKKPSAEL